MRYQLPVRGVQAYAVHCHRTVADGQCSSLRHRDCVHEGVGVEDHFLQVRRCLCLQFTQIIRGGRNLTGQSLRKLAVVAGQGTAVIIELFVLVCHQLQQAVLLQSQHTAISVGPVEPNDAGLVHKLQRPLRREIGPGCRCAHEPCGAQSHTADLEPAGIHIAVAVAVAHVHFFGGVETSGLMVGGAHDEAKSVGAAKRLVILTHPSRQAAPNWRTGITVHLVEVSLWGSVDRDVQRRGKDLETSQNSMKAGSAAISCIPAGQVVGQALLHQLHSILVVVHACVGGALHTNSKSVLAGDSGKVLRACAAASVADLAQVEVQDANLLDKVHRVGTPVPVGAVASSHRPRMVRRGATEGVSEQIVSGCWNVDPPGANGCIRLDVRITSLTGTAITTDEAGWLRESTGLGLHGC
mmetsp:Transcript_71063/g.166365  ORF Transcript_71063/g.166365 Transcript_71063/m.166365 type:complete len:410 (-) Transcript_71063:579-1808(-)